MWCIVGSIIGSSSGSRRNQAAWRTWREKKKSRKKGKQKQETNKKKKRKNKMRTQERKQYDENGKYVNKCMKQNCNREETEGEELTASGRGRLSLQKVRWL